MCLNNNSIIPAIQESERFIQFLIKRFNLNIENNFIITINKANKNTLGYFMPKEHKDHFINTTQDLHNININTLHLKKEDVNIYEVLAHELSHLVNNSNKIKDCCGFGYHNKKFKEQAEKFLLKVEKTSKGFNHTTPTEEFILMLEEFKPNKEVFNFCQNTNNKQKVGSRLRLYICDCGVKVRVAKNDFKALCLDCNTEFKGVNKE